MPLPTDRTVLDTVEEHLDDHNALNEQHNELEGHAADTTAVHGIADTSALALSSHDHDGDYEPAGAAATAVAAVIDAAPGALDTLNELAAALGDDADFAGTVTTTLAGKSDTAHTHNGTYVPLADIDGKGELLVGSADNTLDNLAAGTNGHVLTADSAETLGVKWAAASGGSVPGEYGDGADGVINFDGTATRLGLTPSSGVYTLNRDIFLANGSQVSGTAVIRCNNFRIFCSGTFTIGASAVVHNDANAASGTTGGTSTSAGTLAAGVAGGSGVAGSNGGIGNAGSNCLGGDGGAGGGSSGGPGTGGAFNGGSAAANSPPASASRPRSVVQAHNIASAYTRWQAGGSGGAGNAAASSTGGGGGAAGLVLEMWVYNLVVSGLIRAAGGAGGAASGAGIGAGGGGGGGGGALILVYRTKSGAGSTFAAATNTPGGTGGALQGAGKTGAAGANGTIYEIVH